MIKKLFGFSFIFVLGIIIFAPVYADDIMIDTKNTGNVERVQPVQDKKYIFDETATKNVFKQKGGLIRIICTPDEIKKDIGLLNLPEKIFSIGLEKEGYEYNFDFRNCNIRGNKPNANRTFTKTITEEYALEIAKSFLEKSGIKKRSYSKIGNPIIMYKNRGNTYPIMEAKGGAEEKEFTDIKIVEKKDKTENKEGYLSMSIMFPYTLNGKKIYNQYGGQFGITMEVSAEGVISINIPLMPFKGALRNSEKMTEDLLINYIKKGGNNPFRGQEKEIKLNAPERVFIYSNLWRNNANEMYLGGGIRFGSNIKTDAYTEQNYEMIVSDYKTFNTNNRGY